MPFRFALLVSLILLAACAPRERLFLFQGPGVADLPKRSVFVGTTRRPDGRTFGALRSGRVQYLRLDISIPPRRPVGTILAPLREVDPNTQFLVTDQAFYADAPSFRTELAAALARREGPEREAILYVHGFNNTFDEGVLRITQLAEDFQVEGVAVHYSWPSAANPLGYAYDRDSLLIARDGLDRLISEIRAAGARSLVIVAHSVGSMLVMETLRQRAIARPGSVDDDIDAVVLISPDIDVDLFRFQARRIGDLPQPFGIFVSERDRVLNLSARLTGQRNRLGNVRDVRRIAGLDVTLVDVTELSTGSGHFTAATSPAVIRLFGRAGNLEEAFRGDRSGRPGLLPGTLLTVQNVTEIILSPVTSLAQ